MPEPSRAEPSRAGQEEPQPPPPLRRMPGRPRPAAGGANACAGRDHAARQAEGRSAPRGGEAGRAGSRGGALPPPAPRGEMVPPGGGRGRGRGGCLEGPVGGRAAGGEGGSAREGAPSPLSSAPAAAPGVVRGARWWPRFVTASSPRRPAVVSVSNGRNQRRWAALSHRRPARP